MNIVLISGSPRHGSLTHRVALNLHSQLQTTTSHKIDLVNMQEWNLPFIQSVWSSVDKAPEQFRPLAEIVFAADAFILVSPEYNGSYSPAMKNLLDHFPKQLHKPFGLATASPGPMGGMRATQQLQLLVGGLMGLLSPVMLVVPTIEKKFSAEGALMEPSFQSSIDTFVSEFLWLAERVVVQELETA